MTKKKVLRRLKEVAIHSKKNLDLIAKELPCTTVFLKSIIAKKIGLSDDISSKLNEVLSRNFSSRNSSKGKQNV